MIHLSASDLKRPPASPGFAWWYCDLVGARGEAVVLIWSVGLPFVPVRPHDRVAALERPSLTLSVYRDGREHFYLLAAGAPETSRWDLEGGVYRIGRSTLRMVQSGDEVELVAELDADVPGGGRLTGSVELAGRRCVLPQLAGGDPTHAWSPVATACDARARLQVDGEDVAHLRGRGYLDGNRSDVPLAQLGIADWRWGRIAFADRELVYFHLRPASGPCRVLLLEVARDGSIKLLPDPEAVFEERRPTLYGLRRATGLELRSAARRVATVRFDALVDDGPFYQRYLVEGRDASGLAARGVAERVVPGRLDIGWQRPFIEMRVSREGEAGSAWLPLFAGPRRGRWSRLLSTWARRVAAP